jgi:hypothetical protein
MSQATDNAYEAFGRMQGHAAPQSGARTVHYDNSAEMFRNLSQDLGAIRFALYEMSVGMMNLTNAIQAIESASTRAAHPRSHGTRAR